MSLESKALSYEEMPLKVSKKVLKESGRDYDVRKMDSSSIVWFLVRKHKFGLLVTFTSIYVAFSLFGTLIVGLVESF